MRPKSIGCHLVTVHNILLGTLLAWDAYNILRVFFSHDCAGGPNSCWIWEDHGPFWITAVEVVIAASVFAASFVWLTRLRRRDNLARALQALSALGLTGVTVHAWLVWPPCCPTVLDYIPVILSVTSITSATYVWWRCLRDPLA